MLHTTRAALAVATLAALLVAACGGGSTPPPSVGATAPPTAAATATPAPEVCARAAADAAATVTVELKDFDVNPDPVQAKVGDVIGWTNADLAPHTATMDDAGCATDMIATSQTGRLVFNVPGTYVYHCAIHPTQMLGFKVEITG